MPLKWDLPGGTVEAGETVEETLLREVREETNLNIKPLYPIYVYNNLDQLPIRQTIQIVYLCECLDENNDVIRLNSLEHEEYKWIDFSELNRFDCIAFLNKHYHHCQTTLENIH